MRYHYQCLLYNGIKIKKKSVCSVRFCYKTKYKFNLNVWVKYSVKLCCASPQNQNTSWQVFRVLVGPKNTRMHHRPAYYFTCCPFHESIYIYNSMKQILKLKDVTNRCYCFLNPFKIG